MVRTATTSKIESGRVASRAEKRTLEMIADSAASRTYWTSCAVIEVQAPHHFDHLLRVRMGSSSGMRGLACHAMATAIRRAIVREKVAARCAFFKRGIVADVA